MSITVGWVPGYILHAGLAVLLSPGQFRLLLIRVEITINWAGTLHMTRPSER